MTDQSRVQLFWLKGFLTLLAVGFAGAATILVLFWTSAATILGRSPASAITLVDGLNSGVLGPGEARWFKFNVAPAGGTAELDRSLHLVVSPTAAGQLRRVSLQVFAESQVDFFQPGDTRQMTSLGSGRLINRQANPAMPAYLWSGRLAGPAVYYFQLLNSNNEPISYWLSPHGQAEATSGQAVPAAAPAEPRPAAGASPQTAQPLRWDQNKGSLEPGQEAWYSLTLANADGDVFEPLALTMVATPDDGQRIARMTFQLFTAGAVQNWSPGARAGLVNFGAGSLVSRDANPWTGERVWSGWLVENDRYYLQVHNGADVTMDYWLFTGDLYGPELSAGQEGD